MGLDYHYVKDGHGVIVIAHSQGNLFTNRAYKELGKSSAVYDFIWMQKYFHPSISLFYHLSRDDP